MNRPLPIEALLPSLAGGGRVKSLVRSGMEVLLGVCGVRRLVERSKQEPGGSASARILTAHRIRLAAAGVREALPPAGPVIVIANHPFGAADALALLSLCQQARPDVKFLANAILTTLPSLAPHLIPLEILAAAGPRRNLASLRQSLTHLSNGGLLGIFPAGVVSYYQWRERQVMDPAWSHHVAALALKSGATVVPVRFAGRNPWWFQLPGMFHPLLRSALLLPAFLAGRGRTVQCAAGPPLALETLSGMDLPEATLHLRAAVGAIPLTSPTTT